MGTIRRRLSFANLFGLDSSRIGDQPLNRGSARFPIDFARIESGLRDSAQRSHGWLREWLPRRALVLELGGRPVRFDGISEFEFALAGRTEFPVHRIGELLPMAPVELKRLATNIRQVEKRFADVLAESLDEPGAIGYLLRQLEAKLFSQDHGWRDLMLALAQVEGDYDDFKNLALVKYMQYLGSRQDVLRSIYLEKKYQREEAHPAHDFDPLATYAIGLAPIAAPADTPPLHETAIFEDVTRMAAAGASAPAMRALPRGETLCVNIGDDGSLPVQLSRQHTFVLHAGNPMRLEGPDGTDCLLCEGRNVVGRHAANEVVVDTEHRTVSRRHMVVEPLGANMALITDLSAHGTFVPADRLPEAPRGDDTVVP